MAIFPDKAGQKTRLDPKQCFDLWCELGSLERVRRYLINSDIINENTGRPYTIWGIRVSAYRWIFNHMDEAYKRVQASGSELTRDEFNQWAVWKMTGMAQSNFAMDKWLKERGFFDPTGELGFREIYERKFGRIHADGNGDIQEVSEQVSALW